MFNINDRVTIINRDNANGIINTIEKAGIIVYYGIMLDNGVFVTEIENNIKPRIENPSPLDLFSQANFQSKEVYLVSSVINKMFGNNNDIIATLKSSKTTFLPYQFKPLNKFLKSENRRLLIADEVGLGKTIEAGYILAELFLRDHIKNCLIICKASLKEKWQGELKEKFGFDFEIYNRKELMSKIKEDIKVGQRGVFAIINYDYTEKASIELIELIQSNEYSFDMLIVDEAHILRNEETIKHRGVKKIIESSLNCVFLTATPVMTSLKNLYSLVKILEPRYDYYKDPKQNIDFGYSLFMDHMELSHPFIESLNRLNLGIKPKEVIKDLQTKELTLKYTLLDGTYSNSQKIQLADRFSNDSLFQSVIKMLEIDKFSSSDIALLQKRLSDLNSFQDIITRTRRREVQTNVKKVTRRAEKVSVIFSEVEMDLYQSIINDFEDVPLKLVTRKRQATSCLPAYVERYLSNENAEIIFEDSKFKALKKIIQKVVQENQNKLIIFSFFKDTLRYIEKCLNDINVPNLKIDGDVPIINRQQVINKFKESENAMILLSSEVGSEGLDMQFCDALVNYDLPWNPMVVEQRIGRIDRIGQKSEVIHIYNLCIKDTIEDQIFERLLNRIQIFSQAIGGLEDILSTEESIFATNEGLESIIYGYKLNEEALEKKMREVEIAIENAELTRKEIEENLDDSFLNDQYISDEISQINDQKRFITPGDIKALMILLFQTRLATLRCSLETGTPYIRWSEGDFGLFDFIDQNIPSRKDNAQLYNKYLNFKKQYFKSSIIYITFSQEEAYENKLLEFISPSHPLSQAAFYYFNSQKKLSKNAFSFCIDNSKVPDGLYKNCLYFIMRCKMNSLKYSMAKRHPDKNAFDLIMVFILNEKGEVLELPEAQSNLLFGIDINDWYVNTKLTPNSDEAKEMMDLIRPSFMQSFYKKKVQIEQDLKSVYKSRQFRLIDTEIDFLKRQIERADNIISENSDNSIRFIYQPQIERYQQKIQQLGNQKTKIEFVLEDDFQSITLIQIS
jgi:superfamily II DNA or RNA helicase